jgi:hypothetical protein
MEASGPASAGPLAGDCGTLSSNGSRRQSS